MLADNHVRPRLEPLAAKVPEITIGFWVLKLLTTAMGEAASDYLLSTMSFVGFGIGAAGFVSTLWIQFRTRRYNAFAYWAAVMMVAVFGTMAADVIHHQLGVSFTMSTLFCALGVAATFWAWHRIENTLSVHSIATRRREVFYWLTVSFTFALGTAAGDLTPLRIRRIDRVVRNCHGRAGLGLLAFSPQRSRRLLVGIHRNPTARRFHRGLVE